MTRSRVLLTVLIGALLSASGARLAVSAASADVDESKPAQDASDLSRMSPANRLLAVEEIKQTKARYFRCMDERDWDCFEDTMTQDVDFNVSGALYAISGDTGEVFKSGEVFIDPDEIDQSLWQFNTAHDVRVWESTTLFGGQSVHQGHMPEVTLTSPTTATAIFGLTHRLRFPSINAFEGASFLPDEVPAPELVGHGFYTEKYAKGADGVWRISHLRFTSFRVDIFYGNPVPPLAAGG